MAKFFIIACSILIAWLIVVAFTSHKRVDYLEVKMLPLMYEDLRNTESGNIPPVLSQIVTHRIVCADEEMMEKGASHCTSKYIMHVFSAARDTNATGSEKTRLVQCIRRCPLIYDRCKDNEPKGRDCAEMEAMCLQYCMEHRWRKYDQIHEYPVW